MILIVRIVPPVPELPKSEKIVIFFAKSRNFRKANVKESSYSQFIPGLSSLKYPPLPPKCFSPEVKNCEIDNTRTRQSDYSFAFIVETRVSELR